MMAQMLLLMTTTMTMTTTTLRVRAMGAKMTRRGVKTLLLGWRRWSCVKPTVHYRGWRLSTMEP